MKPARPIRKNATHTLTILGRADAFSSGGVAAFLITSGAEMPPRNECFVLEISDRRYCEAWAIFCGIKNVFQRAMTGDRVRIEGPAGSDFARFTKDHCPEPWLEVLHRDIRVLSETLTDMGIDVCFAEQGETSLFTWLSSATEHTLRKRA